ncbi:unnamed protein product [Ostreobium quekettii]|uniref:Mitochondrial import inner membrane translocase subunit TIM50 n=1 Tax=Ostreobium quekettii TaxID=121088 RepID=A0A8S1IQN1_9CHLO|nr:unnamed protein product [Ostreobium quekettii]|eukprot:evm.model.scf_614.1 EVM.evm.TU.scf_614.1   scf_614:906-2039(+)
MLGGGMSASATLEVAPMKGIGSVLPLLAAYALCMLWQWVGDLWRSRAHAEWQWAWGKVAALWLGAAVVSARWPMARRRDSRRQRGEGEAAAQGSEFETRESGGSGKGMSRENGQKILENISPVGKSAVPKVACKRGCQPSLLQSRGIRPPSSKTMTVVVDLDHTLLACYPLASVPRDVLAAVDSGKVRGTRFQTRDGASVVLAARPGVEEFLTRVSDFAELVLFTAGEEAYAQPLVQWLDPTGSLFSACLFRDATVRTRYHENVKDLWALGRDLSKTVLVDDKPLAGHLQPFNLLPCPPFLGDPYDSGLLGTVLPCLEVLQGVEDVRPALRRGFRTDEYFKSCRIPGEYLRRAVANQGCTCHLQLKPVSHEYLELMS